MKLIDKAAVVAEIENLLDKGRYHEEYDCAYRDGNNDALQTLKDKLNTLEVKEVDEQKDSLTWQDINSIHLLLFDIKKDYDNGKLDKEEYYKEVLKNFKEQL